MSHVLVLGGTSWLGGAVASDALARGHDVTCLARGASGEVPRGAHLVRADRDDPGAYAALPPSTSYDLVVDVARQPGQVRGALEALADRVGHWAFVSSCSVYARHDEPGADESAELLPPATDDTVTPEQYGEGKVACEHAVRDRLGPRALVVRAGLIVGRGDPSERLGYWPGRFALAARDGGPVLVPGTVGRRVQWIDVLDLAGWIVSAGLAGTSGALNAMGRSEPLADLLDAAAAAAGFEGRRVLVPDEALLAAGVEEFMGPRSLPLWLADPSWRAFLDRSAAAAHARGLATRPLEDTLADALEWETSLGLDRTRSRAGLDRAAELAVLTGLGSR
ncbi:MAG: NAD-dependent epimerase/dehydratase family protein [Terracoccus sp.]